jgi:hypothetical protein
MTFKLPREHGSASTRNGHTATESVAEQLIDAYLLETTGAHPSRQHNPVKSFVGRTPVLIGRTKIPTQHGGASPASVKSLIVKKGVGDNIVPKTSAGASPNSKVNI